MPFLSDPTYYLATRVIEIKDHKLIDFQGTYEDYLASQELNAKRA